MPDNLDARLQRVSCAGDQDRPKLPRRTRQRQPNDKAAAINAWSCQQR